MVKVFSVAKARHAKSEFKMLVMMAFCLVALSFFALGFVYAQAPEVGILMKLLVTTCIVNLMIVFYILKKFNALSNT